MPKHSLWRGRIERLGWGGLGLARDAAGRLILLRAPLALFPGEVVSADLTEYSRHSEGEVAEWIEPSPLRVRPACPVAERCGGCDLWGAGQQRAELKRMMARDLLDRQLKEYPEPLWLDAPDWARRHRIQLHWDGKRLGYHARGTNELVEVSGCPLAADALSDAVPLLASALEAGRLPASPGRWELACGTPPDDLRASPTDFDEQRRSWRLQDSHWLPDSSPLKHVFGGITLHQPAGAFFQSCPPWAWRAFAGLFAAWGIQGEVLYDLYGGVGFFSALVPVSSRSVIVESSRSACGAARMNLDCLRPTVVIEAQVENWLEPGLGQPGDVILLDPPRSGLGKSICERLLSAKARTLVLVGCDGAAFCRDLKLLAPAAELKQLAAIDLFPNTVQWEFAALLERRVDTSP
jgi:23S rRNA (uracil1939-C5)-methyltransferase